MGKPPAIQFYVRDWLTDPELRQASLMVRGIWIDVLCLMWVSAVRGVLTGTLESLARLLGISEQEFALFIQEVEQFKFADVTVCHRNITLKNRRMVREEKDRQNNANRQHRFRSNARSNRKVTSPSSSAVAFSKNKDMFIRSFEKQFWPVYPRKQAKKNALKAWSKLKPDDGLVQEIVSDVKRRASSEQWTKNNGEFIPLPASYLNGERWRDEAPSDVEVRRPLL